MQRVWAKISGWWHVVTAILAASYVGFTWVHDVSGYEGRIISIERKEDRQEAKLTRMDYNIQLIGRSIGVKPLAKDADE